MAVELVDVAGIRHVHLVDTYVRITRDSKQFTIRRNSEQIDGLYADDKQNSIIAHAPPFTTTCSLAYRIWILHRAKRKPAIDFPETDGVIISTSQ